jgi:four helix bundle protein
MENEHIFEEAAGGYNEQKDFTSLICWKNERNLKLFFYQKIIPKIPEHEKFNQINQIKRAAVSATANITEGYGRFHYQEGIQFYRFSRGSIYELKDHLFSCNDFGYIEIPLFEEGIKLIETTKISLNGFIKYVEKQKVEKK